MATLLRAARHDKECFDRVNESSRVEDAIRCVRHMLLHGRSIRRLLEVLLLEPVDEQGDSDCPAGQEADDKTTAASLRSSNGSRGGSAGKFADFIKAWDIPAKAPRLAT